MFINTIILSIVQGVTEFLPISSSAHLVLLHHILEDASTQQDTAKIMDIAVHVGTLFAVVLYFYREVIGLIRGAMDIVTFKPRTSAARHVWHLLVASLPVIFCGFLLFQYKPSLFDSLMIIGWMTVLFGVVLYIADRRPQSDVRVEDFSMKHALVYGLAQCLALIPGVSRSGITMTAGRFMHHNRVEAARFSLLMGMVAIAGAGVLAGCSVFGRDVWDTDFITLLAVGVLASFVTAYLAILLMMRWIKRESFTPFVIYRIILGGVLLALLYGGVIPQDM